MPPPRHPRPETDTGLRGRVTTRLMLLMLAWQVAGPVAAQDVFRCGSERAVRYQQAPCEDGRPLNAVDARSSAQASDARLMAEQQSRTAQSMASERHLRDRQASPQAVVIGKRDSLDGPTAVAIPKKRPSSSKIRIVKRAKTAKVDTSSAPRDGGPRSR